MSLPVSLANALPPLPVVLPLIGAAVLSAFRKLLGRTACDAVALFAAALSTLVCACLLMECQARTIVYWFGNWYPRGSIVLGITFVIDPFSATLAALCGLLTFLGLLFSWRFTDSGSNHFQPLMLVFLAGMSGFCLTGDLFNMFVFFELMSTAAFALTGLKTREPAPLQGAFNFAVTNTVAAFMVLTGIAFLYAITGALNMAQIGLALQHRHDALVLFAFALITCGFFTKAAMFPFQFWLADAHAVSPTAVCVLFSGVMVELGLYAVLRLYAVILVPALDTKAEVLRLILLAVGATTAVYGGLMCYAQHHIKRMLAFSTISHSGLMLIAIAIEGPIAAAGFLAYLVGHAFIKSSLFFVSGVLLHRHRSASEPYLFGRGRGQPIAATVWFLGALGLAGAPVFATVVGEALSDHALESAGLWWVSWTFTLAGLLTAGAVFRVGFHTFLGWGSNPISDEGAKVDEKPEDKGEEDEITWWLLAPPVFCIAAGIALAFVPHLRMLAAEAANRLWEQSGYLNVVYKGAMLPQRLPADLDLSVRSAAVHGSIAAVLAFGLSLTSVFRGGLQRAFRIGAFLEGRLGPLRVIQSGHVGDYVTWMTMGSAVLGAAFVFLLR